MANSSSGRYIPCVDTSKQEQDGFFGAARTVAALTMVSRVLGLLRDMALVPLGTPLLADRFWTAFSVPNLFRRLFGEGALSAAFVPVFTDVAEREGWDRARVVLANVGGLLAVLLGGLMVLIWLALAVAWWGWGGDFARAALLQYTAVMLPFMWTVCLLALGSAALNCRGHFSYPAFAPVILNVVLILAAALVAPRISADARWQLLAVSIALLLAGAVQLLGVIWLLRRSGLKLLGTPRPVLPEARRIAGLMGPMVIPLSILQFSAFADRLLALIFTTTPNAPLQGGVVRCLYAANRLYQLPLGVLAISVATVVFPLFSRYAARDDRVGLTGATNRALRLSLFLAIPAGVGLLLIAHPTIELIFQRRGFTSFDTARAGRMLQMYSLGMAGYFCNHILLRAFFAVSDTRRPLILACCLAGLNLILVVVGIHTPLRGSAVGLATAITSSLNAILLVFHLRRRWGPLGLGKVAASTVRIGLASTLMGAAVWITLRWLPLDAESLSRPLALGVRVASAVTAGAVTYALAAVVLRCPELQELRRQPTDSTA